jgi:hypothetical protein
MSKFTPIEKALKAINPEAAPILQQLHDGAAYGAGTPIAAPIDSPSLIRFIVTRYAGESCHSVMRATRRRLQRTGACRAAKLLPKGHVFRTYVAESYLAARKLHQQNRSEAIRWGWRG